MSTPMNQRIRLTKKLLQDSLMEMLQTESIQKISIKALCERAEINRSTFYKYYGSQYDLLNEIEENAVQQVTAILSSHSEEKADALYEICLYLEQNAHYFKPLTGNDSGFMKMILSHPTIQQNIQQEIRRSIGPFCSEAQQEYISDFLTFGSSRIIQLWLNKKDRESCEEIAALLTKLMQLS